MISLLAKEPYFEDLGLVVTLSGGFILAAYAQQKLVGYSTMLPIESMDVKHFSKLYQEHCEHHDDHDFKLEEILSLVDTYPSYLEDSCRSNEKSLISNIRY